MRVPLTPTSHFTSRCAVSNCHRFSSPSVSAIITLAVPTQGKFIYHFFKHKTEHIKFRQSVPCFSRYICALACRRKVNLSQVLTTTTTTTKKYPASLHLISKPNLKVIDEHLCSSFHQPQR